MNVVQLPVLRDNYIYLLRDEPSGLVAVVDPAEAEPVQAELERRGWKLDYVLNTHHHGDHVGGNRALKSAYGCTIVGPRADRDRIPLIDVAVGEGDRFALGTSEAVVYDTPGHTRGHIVYYFADAQALFCGDTLFALGCGRLFEGTPAQMFASLAKLKVLPAATRVFCAHEYTESNWRFAVTVDPGNEPLKVRGEQIKDTRSKGLPTVPSTMGDEMATNPFLRAPSPAELGQVRAAKDVF